MRPYAYFLKCAVSPVALQALSHLDIGPLASLLCLFGFTSARLSEVRLSTISQKNITTV